jgi:hypothetical protein
MGSQISGDYPSSSPRRGQPFLTHSNSEERPLFCRGHILFISDNISRCDATWRPSNTQSRRMDRRWLFRTPPIHQGGGATVTAHDFKREPICQLQWGLLSVF